MNPLLQFLKSILRPPINESTLCFQFEVAYDFSKFPAGATKSDGPYSGEDLCDRLTEELTGVGLPPTQPLLPLLVFLDGTMGYGSSFLKSAFGGLVSREGFTPKYLRAHMKVMSSKDPSLVKEIWEYIDEAEIAKVKRTEEEILIKNIERLNLEGLFELVLRNPHYLTKPKHRNLNRAIRISAAEMGVDWPGHF